MYERGCTGKRCSVPNCLRDCLSCSFFVHHSRHTYAFTAHMNIHVSTSKHKYVYTRVCLDILHPFPKL